MNAASVSRTDLIQGDSSSGDSDSDTNSDGIPEYYEPISSLDNAEEEDSDSNALHCNGYHHHDVIEPHSSLTPSNGHHDYGAPAVEENGVRSLNIGQDQERENQEDEEEEERTRAELDSAMRRALEEDESRRNAPLLEENAVRVMEAMRGITFSGVPPDWATDVSEDRWADQLRRLRHPPHSAAS